MAMRYSLKMVETAVETERQMEQKAPRSLSTGAETDLFYIGDVLFYSDGRTVFPGDLIKLEWDYMSKHWCRIGLFVGLDHPNILTTRRRRARIWSESGLEDVQIPFCPPPGLAAAWYLDYIKSYTITRLS